MSEQVPANHGWSIGLNVGYVTHYQAKRIAFADDFTAIGRYLYQDQLLNLIPYHILANYALR